MPCITYFPLFLQVSRVPRHNVPAKSFCTTPTSLPLSSLHPSSFSHSSEYSVSHLIMYAQGARYHTPDSSPYFATSSYLRLLTSFPHLTETFPVGVCIVQMSAIHSSILIMHIRSLAHFIWRLVLERRLLLKGRRDKWCCAYTWYTIVKVRLPTQN